MLSLYGLLWNKCTQQYVLMSPCRPYKKNRTNKMTKCITDNMEYVFEIYDSWSNGLCCSSGKGSYSVKYKGNLVSQGVKFGYKEFNKFGSCIGSCSTSTTVKQCEKELLQMVRICLLQQGCCSYLWQFYF